MEEGENPTPPISARARWSALQADATRRRDVALGTARATEAAAFPVAVVTAHRARVRRTSAARHAAFTARLRTLLAFVRAHGPEHDERTLDEPAPLSDTATGVVIATCSACRGKCCGNGGDHAFLRTRTIREFVAAHDTLDDEGVIAAYVAHLPARAMHPGCVFQSRAGCTLPRTMRSAICNAYVCVGLQRALDATTPGETKGVYVAHRSADRLTRGALRELPVLGGG